MSEKTNTLELYCKFRGWQGGTIHQAVRDYEALPLEQKHDFCILLVRNLLDVTDAETAGDFLDTLEDEVAKIADKKGRL